MISSSSWLPDDMVQLMQMLLHNLVPILIMQEPIFECPPNLYFHSRLNKTVFFDINGVVLSKINLGQRQVINNQSQIVKSKIQATRTLTKRQDIGTLVLALPYHNS